MWVILLGKVQSKTIPHEDKVKYSDLQANMILLANININFNNNNNNNNNNIIIKEMKLLLLSILY